MNKPTYLPASNVIDLLLDAICVVDRQGRFVFVSAACERIFGYTPEEMLGQPMIELVFPEDRARTLQAADEIMAGTSKPHFENRYVRKDGQIVHIMWSARWSEDDQLRIAVARDITERKRSESMQAATYAISEAAHSAQDLPGLFQRIHRIIGELLPASLFSVVLHDERSNQLSIAYHADERRQPAAPALLDTCALGAQIIRSGQTLLRAPETLATLPQQVRELDCDSLYWLGVPLNTRKGTIGALVVQSYAQEARYTDRDKELLQFVSTQVAATVERQQMLSRLQFMAQYDQLTQLPNRALLYDRLHIALARARREQLQLSLVFLDLDKFKQVNDTFGHAVGDQLLQLVAQRLRDCLRESDTVARLGGDEFVVLLQDFHSPDHVITAAEKIRLALNQPFDLNGQAQLVPPSIGVALYPQHGADAQQLLQHADKAMYLAKRLGGNRFQINLEDSLAERQA
ncbi:diguanylate cyclase domain-containing protein [Pseudomonas zhanjiangensis]|uniref:Diguanylate cyclase n=1 Tax=Pseudomonas zhanjiangensis TaxID=3239015 RepID=A0ABV3YP58_9PSED